MIEIENQSGSRADRSRGGQSKSGGDNNGVDDADATKLKEIGEKSSYKRSYLIIIKLSYYYYHVMYAEGKEGR